ncbi:hypothetical protein [Spiroplasma endosymbiont of Villa modesta]
MAGDKPTNDELENAIINAGNNGYEKGKAKFDIKSTSATMTGNNSDYYGVVNLEFTKK